MQPKLRKLLSHISKFGLSPKSLILPDVMSLSEPLEQGLPFKGPDISSRTVIASFSGNNDCPGNQDTSLDGRPRLFDTIPETKDPCNMLTEASGVTTPAQLAVCMHAASNPLFIPPRPIEERTQAGTVERRTPLGNPVRVDDNFSKDTPPDVRLAAVPN